MVTLGKEGAHYGPWTCGLEWEGLQPGLVTGMQGPGQGRGSRQQRAGELTLSLGVWTLSNGVAQPWNNWFCRRGREMKE